MPHYSILVKVDQIVTKEIKMRVSASSLESAEDKAREALQTYPEPCFVEGVNRILTKKARYWIPKSIEFIREVEEKKSA